MSLPSHINTGDENFFVIDDFTNNSKFLYYHSLKDSDGISDKSIMFNTNDEGINT